MRVARPRRQSNRHIPVNLYTSMTDQEKRRETEIEMYPCHYIFSVSSSLRLVLAYAQKLTPNKNILNTAKYSKGLCRYGHRHTVLVMTERNYTRVSDKSQYTHFLLRKILHCLPLKVKKKKKKKGLFSCPLFWSILAFSCICPLFAFLKNYLKVNLEKRLATFCQRF